MSTPLDPMRALYGAGTPSPVTPTGPANAPGAAPVDANGKSFGDVLADFVKQADQTQQHYDDAIAAVERGETDNLHTVMLAQNEAQISLKLAAEVRNKLVEAYKDVMRTQF